MLQPNPFELRLQLVHPFGLLNFTGPCTNSVCVGGDTPTIHHSQHLPILRDRISGRGLAYRVRDFVSDI